MKIDSSRLVTLRNGQQGLRCAIGLERVEVKTSEAGKRIHYFRASDATIDRYNEVIEPKGWVLDEYTKNNVIVDSHRYDSIQWVLGNGVDCRVTDSGLVIGIQFSDSNPLGRMAEGMVEEGTIKSGSVGFIPLDYRQGKKGEPTRTYTRQNLLEFSLTSIPANPNALKLSLDAGYVNRDDIEQSIKILERAVGRNTEEILYSEKDYRIVRLSDGLITAHFYNSPTDEEKARVQEHMASLGKHFCSGKATDGTDSRSKSALGDVEQPLLKRLAALSGTTK